VPSFDAYHKWLGIRPEEQPANHYRLLGINLFEGDADAIASAADQRMAHVRSFQTGKHTAFSQRILNELASARVCLLNPEKKAAYDQTLRAQLTPSPPNPPATQPMKPPTVVEPSSLLDFGFTPTYKKQYKKPTRSWMPWAFVGVGGLVAAGLLLAIAGNRRDEQKAAKVPPSRIVESQPATEVEQEVVNSPDDEVQVTKKPKVDRKPETTKPELTLLEDTSPLPEVEPPAVDEETAAENRTLDADGSVARMPDGPVVGLRQSDTLDLELLKKLAERARTAKQHLSVAERAKAFAEEAVGNNNVAAAEQLKQMARAETGKTRRVDGKSRDADDDTPAANARRKGLEWLISQQQDDGHWTFTANPNPGNLANSPCCATAMALIPLLRAGYTHREGEHREVINKGLKFLSKSMAVNSNVGKLFEPGSRMYGHAICTIALCEAYARTRDKRLRDTAQAAVNFIVYAQDPKGGGWRYEPRQGGDTSVTGWQLAALSVAQAAKLPIPPVTFAKADGFLDSVQMGEGVSYKYRPDDTGGPANTAVGLLCRIYLGCKKDHPALQRGMGQVSDAGPSPDNMYFNYYGTQLLRHAQADRWLKWRTKICDQLVLAQSIQEDSKGSWYFPNGSLGTAEGGRLYFTSMAVMILQFCEPTNQSEGSRNCQDNSPPRALEAVFTPASWRRISSNDSNSDNF
jgi:hypothetical protein